MRIVRAHLKSTFPNPPHIIWIEHVRVNALILTVLAPSPIFRKPRTVDSEGPLYYTSPEEESTYMTELIATAQHNLPPNARFQVALSLAEVREIIATTWGVRLPDGSYPRHPRRRQSPPPAS